jgi:L-amino acid N-acyltransferase YncA
MVELRRARLEDAEALREIYNAEVLGSTVTFDLVPRSPEDQLEWMAAHAGAYPVVVATDGPDGEVVGFSSLSPYRSRPGYAPTVEDSVYVAAGHRGRGVGRLLLGEIVRLAAAHGFHSVIGRVVGDHPASIALHRSLGFQVVGVEREVGRKFGRWLDVTILQRMC